MASNVFHESLYVEKIVRRCLSILHIVDASLCPTYDTISSCGPLGTATFTVLFPIAFCSLHVDLSPMRLQNDSWLLECVVAQVVGYLRV